MMLQLEVLVGKLVAVNRFAARAALDHKSRDDSMEDRALQVQRYSPPHPALPRAKRAKVLGRLRHDVRTQQLPSWERSRAARIGRCVRRGGTSVCTARVHSVRPECTARVTPSLAVCNMCIVSNVCGVCDVCNVRTVCNVRNVVSRRASEWHRERAHQLDAASGPAVDGNLEKDARVAPQLRLVVDARGAAAREAQLVDDAQLHHEERRRTTESRPSHD